MISHERKFIFVHVPKTAGVSIGNCLSRFTDENLSEGHKRLIDYSNFDKTYFKFTFTRNPWDRFLSSYFYFKNYGRRLGYDIETGKLIDKFSSFKEFVHNLDSIYNSIRSPHFKIQFNWIDKKLNFIGRFENLQEDFDTVCDKIGIPKQNLPHTNKSKHKHYTEYYDDETRKIVAEKYAKDIEYFGYEFGE